MRALNIAKVANHSGVKKRESHHEFVSLFVYLFLPHA